MTALLDDARPVVSPGDLQALAAGLVPHSFPGRDDVASMAERLRPRIGMHVGPGFTGHLRTLVLSPGTVRLSSRLINGLDDITDVVLHGTMGERAQRALTEELAQGAAASLLGATVIERPDADNELSAKRRAVTSWSRGSRKRLLQTILELDLSQWSDDGGLLAMVTLTLPGAWEMVAPNGRAFKALIAAFREQWKRHVRTPWRGIWKLEFQERGAPHLHALMRVPGMVRTRRYGEETFEAWLSRTWAGVCLRSLSVDDQMIYVSEEHYSRHLLAGTGVDFSGVKFSDPRRTSVYFVKHSSKTRDSKEYQHIVPELWRDEGAGPGRFWGVWGLKRATASVILDEEGWKRANRVLRHVAKASGQRVRISRLRAEYGDVAYRFIAAMPGARRPGGFRSSGGGWVGVHDGLATAYDLARWLQQVQ